MRIIIFSNIFSASKTDKASNTTSVNSTIQERSIIEIKATSTQEEKLTPVPKETPLLSYRNMVEKQVASFYNNPNDVDFFIWTAYRQWELDGLVYVENNFKLKDSKIEHKYLAGYSLPFKDELGETITIAFYLKIDGETIFWDEERETKYIDEK